MKIALDARWIFDEISGIGLYTRELIRHLARLDQQNEYVLLFQHARLRDRTAEETGFGDAAHMEARLIAPGVFSLAGQTAVPRMLRELAPDLYHSPNYMIPLRSFPRSRRGPIRCVVTLHDVIPLAHPDHAPRSRKRRLYPVYRALMKDIGMRAHTILTVSEASKVEVIKHLHIPANRGSEVVVVHNGVSEAYHPPEERPLPRAPTVLYVGRFDPYKNLVVLVEAMGRVRRRIPDARLRVVGPPDARYPEAPQRAAELGIDEAIEWAGYVDNQALIRAYQDADVFALPSRYEGFGLPVLEAMACGTPVVCGNRSSLPEVAGDAALLVDPDRADALADALIQVLTQPTVASNLREKGLARARAFTWSRAADQTLTAYGRLAPPERPARRRPRTRH